MRNINGEVLGNLFRSTQQLAAFEAFLAQMAMQASATGGGAEENEPEPQQRRARQVEQEEDPAAPADNSPRLIIPQRTPPSKQSKFQNVGRNDPCPCGSGKKFKQCCGRTA